MELSIDPVYRHWWAFLIRGLLFLLVGIYMIASPASSYVALGFMFGLIIFLAGVAEFLHVTRDNDPGSRGWHLMLGIIDVILGIVLMGHITTSVAILRFIVGIWFLLRGISVFRFSRRMGKSLWLTLGAVLIILFGLLILFNPTFGDMTIILWTAIAFIITGLFNIWIGAMMRRA